MDLTVRYDEQELNYIRSVLKLNVVWRKQPETMDDMERYRERQRDRESGKYIVSKRLDIIVDDIYGEKVDLGKSDYNK